MSEREVPSISLREELALRFGHDPTVQTMIRDGLPLTRQTYWDRAFAGLEDEDVGPELQAEIPEILP